MAPTACASLLWAFRFVADQNRWMASGLLHIEEVCAASRYCEVDLFIRKGQHGYSSQNGNPGNQTPREWKAPEDAVPATN
jgi:hypothetical protein